MIYMHKLKKLVLSFVAIFALIFVLASCGSPEYTVNYHVDKDLYATAKVVEGNLATKPDNPRKDYYTFDNWYQDESLSQVYDFNSPVRKNLNLYAKFNIVKYTISFNTNGGNDIDSKKIDANTTIDSLPIPTKNRFEFKGWYKDSTFTTPVDYSTKVVSDMTLYAKWQEKYFVVSFNPDNDTRVFTEIVEENNFAVKPSSPEKIGYSFLDWVTEDDVEFDFNTPITTNLKLKAKYVLNEDDYCIVTFDTCGGSSVPARLAYKGEPISLPLSVKSGYILDGWYRDSEYTTEFTSSSEVNDSITLYAKWVAAEGENYYTVVFNPDNGSLAFTENVRDNKLAIKPSSPEKAGYTFLNWVDEDGNTFDFNTPITKNINLKATYIETDDTKYVVSFEANGGTTIPAIVVEPNSKISLPLSTRYGYILEGWYTDSNFTTEFTKDTIVNQSIVLYAKWRISTDGLFYTVTFNPNNGEAPFDAIAERNKKIAKPENPVRDGYTFVCWDLDDEAFSFNTLITENITLVARWRHDENPETCIVTFATYDGSLVNSVEVSKGETLKLPADPYREDYSFGGWFTDFNLDYPFNPETPITEDIVLHAKWIYLGGTKYSVTFIDYDGNPIRVLVGEGVYVFTQQVEEGSDAKTPADPIRDGYRFIGWSGTYTNVYTSAEIRAQYVKAYDVYFYDYNRTILKYEQVDFGNSPIAPDSPERYGYRFTGWDKDFNYITQDTIIQATYMKQYEIKFRDYNGELISRTWYDEGATIIAPDVPEVTIIDKEFAGWDQEFDKAVQDVTIRMTLATKAYTVRFIDIDNTVLSSQVIYVGKDATAPDLTDKIYIDWKSTNKQAYKFKGWDNDFTAIDANLDVKAQYDLINKPLIYVQTSNIAQGQTKVEVSVYLIYPSEFEALHMDIKISDYLDITDSSVVLKGQFNRGSQSNINIDTVNNICSFNCINTDGFNLSGYYSEILRISIDLDKYSTIGEYPITILDTTYLTNNGVVKILQEVIDGGIVIE